MQYIEVTFGQAFDNDYLLSAGSIGRGRIRISCLEHGEMHHVISNFVIPYDIYTRYDRGDNQPYTDKEKEEFRLAYESLLNECINNS